MEWNELKKLEYEGKEFCDMETFFTWGVVKNDEECSDEVTNYFGFGEERKKITMRKLKD